MSDTLSIEDFEKRLTRHDWFYYMSDDHGVWQRGERDAGEIMGLAKTGSPEHRKAYNRHHAKHFHKESFAKPWNFPFPEDGI